MRAGPVLLKFFAHAFGDEMHGQARSVSCDDGAGFAKLGDAREQSFLDLQIFGYYFDDPVGVLAAGQIIFQISDGDFCRRRQR